MRVGEGWRSSVGWRRPCGEVEGVQARANVEVRCGGYGGGIERDQS
jgi:hypothetical protein